MSLGDIGRDQIEHIWGVYGLEERAFSSWSAYLDDYYERQARKARDLGTVDVPTDARIRGLLDRHRALFEGVTEAALLHSDYHWENILQQGGHVTGILDSEWAHSGDTAFDCRIDDDLEAMCLGSVAPFYQGYESIRPLQEHHALKARIYQLLLRLETLADRETASEPERCVREQRKLLDLLACLESGEEPSRWGDKVTR